LKTLLALCWHEDANRRPLFREVCSFYCEFNFVAGKASVQGGAMFALILGIGSALRGCLK